MFYSNRCSWCGGKLRRSHKLPKVGTCCDKRGVKVKGKQTQRTRQELIDAKESR